MVRTAVFQEAAQMVFVVKSDILKKIIQYIGGMFLVAIGINISKLTHLGISPVSSVPRAAELIWGLTLGTATIALNLICILVQFLLLRKRFKPINILQVLVSVAFGYIIDLTGTDPNAFGHLMLGFPLPQTYLMRMVYMLVSVVFIGLGVYVYMRPGWVPMASDGLSKTVAEVMNKPFGNAKTMVDTILVLIAAALQIIFLGGLSSFAGSRVVVREGTFIAAIFVGQVVKLFTKLFEKNGK